MVWGIIKAIFARILRLLAVVVPKDRSLILFGAFSGEHFGDNSAALYTYLLQNNPKGWRLVWMTDQPAVVEQVRQLGGAACLKRSGEGLWLSLRCSLTVTSHGPEDAVLFYPSPGSPPELYLHHGVPLRHGIFREKKRWFEAPPVNSRERFQCISMTISTSEWAAQQQQKNVLVELPRIKITGLPRHDVLFDHTSDAQLKARFQLGSRMILYAPTWRDWEAARFFPFADFDLRAIVEFLRQQQTVMVLRPHHTDLRRGCGPEFWEQVRQYPDVFKIITVREHAAVEDLLRLSGLLITDYSSLHYDFLLLDRPLVYLPYDRARYVREMGEFNCDYDSFTPGPKPVTQTEFLDCLRQGLNVPGSFQAQRQWVRSIVFAAPGPGACARVAELITQEFIIPQ